MSKKKGRKNSNRKFIDDKFELQMPSTDVFCSPLRMGDFNLLVKIINLIESLRLGAYKSKPIARTYHFNSCFYNAKAASIASGNSQGKSAGEIIIDTSKYEEFELQMRSIDLFCSNGFQPVDKNYKLK